MYVARQYRRGRTFTQLTAQVLEGFRIYGTVQHCSSKVRGARVEEENYIKNGVYSEPIDVDALPDDEDSENDDEDLDDEESLSNAEDGT